MQDALIPMSPSSRSPRTILKTPRLDPEALPARLPHSRHGAPRQHARWSYLDNAATSQRPRQVIQAIVDTYERHYANVHRGIHWLADQSTELYEGAREKVCAFIHASRPRSRSSSPTGRPRPSTWWPAAGATPTCTPATRSC